MSRDTCTPGRECGTVESPFCTILRGVERTPDGVVLVAGSSSAYQELVTLRSGVSVQGGYDTAFTGARSLSGPATTKLLGSVYFPAGATATLDGVEVLAFALPTTPPKTPPDKLAAIRVVDAHATLVDVAVNQTLTAAEWATPAAKTAVAVEASLATGGSLTLTRGTFYAPRAVDESRALAVSGVGPVSLDGSALIGGPALSCRGIVHDTAGTLRVRRTAITTPWGSKEAFGIQTAKAGTVVPGAVTIQESSVRAGPDAAVTDPLAPANQYPVRIGVLARDVPLTIETSDIVASPATQSAQAMGVLISAQGTSLLPVVLRNNTRIEGGLSSPWVTYYVYSIGASVVGAIDLQATGNRLIAGSSVASGGESMGLFLHSNAVQAPTSYWSIGYAPTQPAASWTVTGNDTIQGGPGPGADDIREEGIFAYGQGFATYEATAPLPRLVVEDNQLIVGNQDPAVVGRPGYTLMPYAIFTRLGLDIVIRNNHLQAGPGVVAGGGIRIERETAYDDTKRPVHVTITDNVIEPTTAAVGISLMGVDGTVDHNLVKPNGRALIASTDRGTVYSNNYFFGVGTACDVGGYYITQGSFGWGYFVNNTCYAQGEALVLIGIWGRPEHPSVIQNNVFDRADTSDRRTVVNTTGGFAGGTISMLNNVFALHAMRPNDLYSCVVKSIGADVLPAAIPACQDLASLVQGNITGSGNTTVIPTYVDPASVTAEGYALGGACNLAGQGRAYPAIEDDFFHALRPDPPAIGASECRH